MLDAYVPAGGSLALDLHILIPGVQNGLGAMLVFNADNIGFLEMFTYGDDGEMKIGKAFSFVGLG